MKVEPCCFGWLHRGLAMVRSKELTHPPVDLEIRVTTPWGNGGQTLEYVLSSPSGAVDFHHAVIHGESIHSPDHFQRELFQQLERLHDNLDVDGGQVLGDEVFKDLTTIGYDLYRRLFSPQMQQAYQRFRDRVETLLITSDEPWIPWELLRPLDSDSDDFFCMKFRMSRWLAGETHLPQGKHVASLACFEVGRPEDFLPLPHAAEECRLLENLAAEAGLRKTIRSQPCFSEVEDIFREGEVDLIHFVGHGNRDEARPDEAKIVLADRPFRVRHLGPLQAQLKRHRPVVFFNACRLARLGQTLTGNGGWAERWVKHCGASAFLAPFWSVGDRRALRFAEVFYEKLKAGKTLGDAILRTRHQLRLEDRNEMAWLAYSLYGHPGMQVTFGDSQPAVTEKTRGKESIPVGGRRDLSAAAQSDRASRNRRQVNRGARRRRSHQRRALIPLAVASSVMLVGLFVLLSSNWVVTSTPVTSDLGAAGHTDTATESSRPDPSVIPFPPPAAVRSIEDPHPTEPPRQEIPLLPIVSGRIGIVVFDKETRQPDRDVADAIETILARTSDDIAPVILRMELADAEGLLNGSLPMSPGVGLSRQGVEHLLVATTSLEEVPLTTSTLEGAILTMKAQLIAADSGSARLRSNATHKGLGHSAEAALAQAAERCLREITNRLTEGDTS